ncbi:unnamed protein product [Allacma fusca]|uniref:Uncharacterized protein n=1 Tax=Allacma fusca TaxID=39272 RepID=A0A8J2NSG5_9HEXA|nr:unnamed protein product [Allacma fusca]
MLILIFEKSLFAFFVTILAIGILVTNANVLASSQKVTFVVDAEGTIIGQSRGAQQDPGGVIQVGEPVIIDEYNFVGDDDDGEGDFGGGLKYCCNNWEPRPREKRWTSESSKFSGQREKIPGSITLKLTKNFEYP